jgi:hypothetical protein
VALRPAIAAVHLQELSFPDQIADRQRLEPERLRLASASGLVPVLLQLGKPGDQLRDPARLVIDQPGIGDGYRAIKARSLMLDRLFHDASALTSISSCYTHVPPFERVHAWELEELALTHAPIIRAGTRVREGFQNTFLRSGKLGLRFASLKLTSGGGP